MKNYLIRNIGTLIGKTTSGTRPRPPGSETSGGAGLIFGMILALASPALASPALAVPRPDAGQILQENAPPPQLPRAGENRLIIHPTEQAPQKEDNGTGISLHR